MEQPSATTPGAGLRLFCFPGAGGTASLFRAWRALMPASIDLACVELPGADGALARNPDPWPAVAREVTDSLLPHLDVPFSFFGHSLGALLAFEVARDLRARLGPQPRRLLVSACGAPHRWRRSSRLLHRLPDAQLLAELRRLNGTPREVLEEPELAELFLPVLRLDFRILETYRYRPERPLECPIAAMGGQSDPVVSASALEAWREQTRADFRMELFPGDHFFLSGTGTGPVLRSIARMASCGHGTSQRDALPTLG